MKRTGKRLKWVWVAVVFAFAAAFGYVVLARPAFLEIDVLKGKPIVKAGLISAAHRSDEIEPYEYFEYVWNDAFANTRARLGAELSAKGFSLTKETAQYVSWRRDDLGVFLYASRDPTPSSTNPKGSLVPDRNWSLVYYWRVVDNGWLTQFRMWLLERRSPSD